MTITITVAGRIATATATTQVVAGNTYPVAVSLDSEWTGNLFMRVRFGSLYYDIPFASTDTAVNVQFPVGYPEVGIGVFSETLQVCTNEVRVKLLRSILEAGEQVVEFDGDLYDQWSTEVTTLLTDDAFDATSTKPVQNAVITAWKDTVALDANVVHKTGNEDVAGQKTFTNAPRVLAGTPTITLRTDTQSTGTGQRAKIEVFDAYSGEGTALGADLWGASSGYDYRRFVLRKPDRSAEQSMEIRSYPDHMLMMVTPYYPVDGDGNPQALTSSALVASGNIAVDPRIVHTTGSEVVAGQKTFTNVTNLDGGKACRRVSGTIPAGKCMRLYNVTTYTMRAMLHIVNTNLLTTFFSRTVVSVASSSLGGFKDIRYPVRLARFADHTEIWIQNDTTSSTPIVCDIEYGYSNLPTADGTVADSLPEVGTDGCTEIYDLGEWQ